MKSSSKNKVAKINVETNMIYPDGNAERLGLVPKVQYVMDHAFGTKCDC